MFFAQRMLILHVLLVTNAACLRWVLVVYRLKVHIKIPFELSIFMFPIYIYMFSDVVFHTGLDERKGLQIKKAQTSLHIHAV